MDISYLKVLDKLRFAVVDMKGLIDKAPMAGFENDMACSIIENVIDEMDTAISRVEVYTMPAAEGVLSEMSNGKYELINKWGESITYFSCGSYIEIYSKEDKEWHAGRVEHNGKYYFRCPDIGNPSLYDGMRARIRKE